MKKILISILILFLSIQVFTAPVYGQQNEVAYYEASSWAISELNEAAKNGLISEKIKNKMNAPITREEFAELAVRLYEAITGEKAAYGALDAFVDTKNMEVYKAFNLKIVNGTNMKERLFSPDEKINREQAATMLYRTIKAIKADEDFSINNIAVFLDEKEASAWAVDSIKYMNKQGYLLGLKGKMNPKDLSTREMAVIMANRIYKKYALIEKSTYQESNNKEYILPDKAVLVINDFDILSENYRIVTKDDFHYIFVEINKFKYGFKSPYAGYYSYPDVVESNGKISVVWQNESKVILRIDMMIDSSEIQINGKAADVGIAPYREGEKTFIPINLFMAVLEMNLAEESTEDIIFIQYKKDFPKEVLVGSWSEIETNLFTDFKDIQSKAVAPASYAPSYMFENDGTYRKGTISVGGFHDTLIIESGKYIIMGNTIMYYDIAETLYQDKPFMLSYSNRYYKEPRYGFIDDYNVQENRIRINGVWLNKK